jgi:uncharacterized protein YjiK
MKNTLHFVLAAGKSCSGAWLALLVLALTSLSTVPAEAQASSLAYTFSTLAGKASEGSADGIGSTAQFFFPADVAAAAGVAADTNGNLYVADTDNHTIRKVTSAGVVSTIAGFAGIYGSTDGTGSNARFSYPTGIAVDNAGNLYVADNDNNEIRKITPVGTNWVVSTIAGSNSGSLGSADGTGSNAQFWRPCGIAVDKAGNLYVADTYNFTIRKITPVGTNWVVSTIAGLAGSLDFSADGTGSNARFEHPEGIAVDNAGNLYVADTFSFTIRKITLAGTNWVVSTIAGLAPSLGNPVGPGSADGTGSNAGFYEPGGIAVDSADNLYVADTDNQTIRKVTPVGTNWVVSTIAGLAGSSGSVEGTGSNARFNQPWGIAVDSAGNLYLGDSMNSAIRKVTSAGVVSTLAGGGGGVGIADGTGGSARFNLPYGIAVDKAGNLYVADSGNNTIRKITSAGVVSTLAGLAGSSGSADGAGSNARFSQPWGIAADSAGNLYVADPVNSTIRKVTPAGVVSTLAGWAGVNGNNDGTGSNARFNQPSGLAVDSADNLYVADTENQTIRKVTPVGTNWVVSTIAGLAGSSGSDDGTGSDARFNSPVGIAVDNAGNLYVADTDNQTIRKVTPVGTNWVVSTDGNDIFTNPQGIAVDSMGNVYVAETAVDGQPVLPDGNERIQEVTLVDNNWFASIIGGFKWYSGSADGAGSAARFYGPFGVVVDNTGIVYVADTYNCTIRKGVFSQYGTANAVTYSPPPMNSSLTLILGSNPPTGAGWRFPWEVAWHNSGNTASNLVAGNYPVEFSTVPGYLVIPFSGTVGVTNNTVVINQYYPTVSTSVANNSGTLTLTLGPNPPNGAGWGFLGASPPFYPSGYSTNLVAGTYLITFAPVSGRVTPPNLSVQVQTGQPTYLSENYVLAQSAPGGVLLPTPVPATNISDYPFGFNGQLQTDVGYGSGVAVAPNVVLTAAHLVFNDQTLSYVNQAYWYFQEEAGVHQPQPIAARGWYVLSGYASQRTNDLQVYSPDTSTPQSRNLDVAALYCLSPVAGGGYAGYLPSDASPNQWLTSTALKMLVGYPVDGSQFGDATIVPGEMYQTGLQPYPLTLATDPVSDQQVYTATWFLSYPGNSGGPVYVQFNGNYYPAGVYLGTLYNGVTPYASAVRAIDSDVVNLITNAANLGDTGTNNTGGGVITIIPNQAINANNPGYVQLQLGPPAAVRAGAAWRLQGDTAWSTATNYTEAVLSTNAIGVQFKPIAGWNLPTNQSVSVFPLQIVTPIAFYTVTNPVLVANATLGIGIMGTTGTVYEIESRTSLTSGSWAPVSTNTITANGFNLVLPKPGTNGTTIFYRAVWLGQ